MVFFSTLLLSVLLTVALVPMLRPLALRLQMVDEPGGRKVHSRPIPRVGGMAMAVGIFVPVVLWDYADRFVWAYLSGAAIIVAFEKGGTAAPPSGSRTSC